MTQVCAPNFIPNFTPDMAHSIDIINKQVMAILTIHQKIYCQTICADDHHQQDLVFNALKDIGDVDTILSWYSFVLKEYAHSGMFDMGSHMIAKNIHTTYTNLQILLNNCPDKEFVSKFPIQIEV